MAFFKSAEEKQANLLEKYGLTSLHNAEDIASVQKIAEELAGSGLMEAGLKLAMAKAEVQLPISLQRAIMEQNFIIIRQLDRIATMLENK